MPTEVGTENPGVIHFPNDGYVLKGYDRTTVVGMPYINIQCWQDRRIQEFPYDYFKPVVHDRSPGQNEHPGTRYVKNPGYVLKGYGITRIVDTPY